MDLRCLESSGWINFIWDEIDLFQNFGIYARILDIKFVLEFGF